MIAPIFPICSASSEVINLLGANPVRLYPFKLQTDQVVYPYAVWTNLPGGGPENYLKQRPDADSFSIQVDVYAKSAEEVISVAKALRDSIEPHAYIVRWGEQDRDDETKSYHYSFDVDWIVPR
ncbi:tail completion protein gp17 [Enterobacter kobei]|uniref:tail completion protein gp17 n=1 Tax=Enterobacter kobei TaxID=208224 RepID=UPI003D65B560|nr:hypothetical protein [Enterobacter asburiae]